jgi:hypothetical protein
MKHTSSGKIWDRDAPLDERIERFTVGRDRELDLRLVAHDALASARPRHHAAGDRCALG